MAYVIRGVQGFLSRWQPRPGFVAGSQDISMARPMRKQVGLCVLDEWMVVEEVKMSECQCQRE